MHIAYLGVKGMPHPGGIETVVEQVGRRLAARGHAVTVYVRPHYTPRTRTRHQGMQLVHTWSIPTRSLDAFTHTASASVRMLARRADIAHIHSIGLSVFAPPLHWRGIKTVVTSHGLDWQRAKWGALARAYLKFTDWTTARLPDAMTVVSRQMQRYYFERYGRQAAYIPNGVNLGERQPPDEIRKLGLASRQYILFAARLVPEKGCHYLLEAYRRLPQSDKKLVIAGDENYASRYAEQLKKHANENIIFVGFARGRLYQELLSHAYLYVLPSELEGLSTGLLEAMAYGNCVLVSDIPENVEVVGEDGVYFESRNVSDLERKLAGLLNAPERVRTLGERAQVQVPERYGWERVADQYEQLYERLVVHRHATRW